jgi:glycosyl transferase family 25
MFSIMPFDFVFTKENSFCISLKSKPERWLNMNKRFLYFGLEVTQWEASTSENITDYFPDYLNGGQKGCAQSHIRIWRHMLENNLEYALILEDDACFDKEWLTKLRTFDKENWDIICLNASEPISTLHSWECTLHNLQYLTAGYILSKTAAEKLLKDFGNYFFSSDWMTSRLQIYGHGYCYFPWLIIQEGIDSTIGSNLDADHQKVLRCLGDIDYSLENYI